MWSNQRALHQVPYSGFVISPDLIGQEVANFLDIFAKEKSIQKKRQRDFASTLKAGTHKFEAAIDVHLFKPEEISVKVTGDNIVTVEGKHEEQEDEHGHISRHLVRRFVLPKGYDVSKVESRLASGGTLTIEAPKVGALEGGSRTIPVTYENAKAVDEKKMEQ